MYHSSATLLPDGSVFVAGSNPNVDVIDDWNNASYVHKVSEPLKMFEIIHQADKSPSFV